jgi:adenylosuccinate synthase
MTKLHIVADLQFGSTGKGSLAYLLGEYLRPDVVVTAWGPNAGHSAQAADGIRWVHTMLANSMVCGSVRTQLIGPGSAVNLAALLREVLAIPQYADYSLRNKRIIIHPQACIVTAEHAEAEKKLVRVGSTMKGTAAAMIDKMWRDPRQSPLARDLPDHVKQYYTEEFASRGVGFHILEGAYNIAIDYATTILLEGCQGFSLGSHTHFWPHTTSRDISPAQMAADCRIPFSIARGATVWGTARTFPIRVANRYDDKGNQIGTSGPGYSDQKELRWREDLGREPELTTVTKLPRRIFQFSREQIIEACRVCSPQYIVLTFCDYLGPRPANGDLLPEPINNLIDLIFDETSVRVAMVTFGPSIADAMLTTDDGRAWDLHWQNFQGVFT